MLVLQSYEQSDGVDYMGSRRKTLLEMDRRKLLSVPSGER